MHSIDADRLRQFALLLAGLFFSIPLTAQNYLPFSDQPLSYRYTSQPEVSVLRVDSMATVNSESWYYFNEIVGPYDTSACYNPNRAYQYSFPYENLFGNHLYIPSSGEFHFVSVAGDSIVLYPYQSNSWAFLTGSTLTASIVSRTYEPLFGTMDSVVTIQISDGNSIRLSENHGFSPKI